MAIDLKSYYEKNRAYYGDVPLEKVAQDVYTRSAEKQPYDQWLGSTGIQGQIEEDNYQRSVQTARNQDIGLVKEFGRGLVRGVTQSLPQAVGQGIQWLNPDQGGSDTLETLGKSIETFGNENARKLPEYSPSKKVDTSFWHRAAASAGESTPASLAPFAVGSLASAVAGPVAGIAAGAASMIPTFYGATAEQKYREGEQAGLSPEKNMLNANIAGASEVITEGLSDLVPYALFGKLTAPAKGALLKGLTEGKPFTQILKDVLATGAAETSTEALNVGIQAASDKYAGLESKQNVGSDALDAAGSAAIMTLVFSAVGIPFDAYHRSSIRKTLADPTADPKKTMTAINEVATAAAEHDPQLAELFADRAVKLAAAGKPIVIDDDEAYRSSPWAPPTKTVVDPAEKAKSIILLAKSNIPDEDLDKLTADPVTLRQYGLEPTDIAIAKQEREAVKSIVGAHQAEIDAAPSEPVKQGMIAALNKDIETSAITRVTKALKAQVEVESAAEPKGIDTSEAVTPQSILADTTALRQSNRQVDLKNFVDKYGLSAYSYAMRTTPETFKISDFMSQVADRYAETTGKPTPNLSPEDIKARETLVSTLNAKSTYGEVKSVAEALGVPLTVETDGKVTSIGKKKLLAKVRDQAFLDRLSEPETTTPTTASTTASTTALARAATAPAAAPVLAPTENTKGIPIKGLTPTRIKELAKEHGITETAGPKIIRELVNRGVVASPTSKPTEVPTGKKGIIAPVEGKDLTKIMESAVVAFPDIPESTEGVLPLSRFLPDEQESLRNAGIVETVTTAKGQAYEGVNPEYLWERRKQIQAGSEPKKTQPVLLREFAAKHGIDTSLPDMVIKAELAKRKIGIPAEIANTGLVSNPDLREAIAIEGAKTDTTKVSDKDLLSHAEKDAYIPVDADLKWVDKSKLRRVAETRGIDHTGMSRKQLIAALKLPAQAKDSKAQAKVQSTVQPTVSQKITTKLDFMGRKELSEAAAFAGIPVKKKDKADTIAKKLTKAGITEVVRDETDKVIGVNKTEKAAPETKPEIKPGIESVDMLRRTELVKIAEQVGIKTGHKNASDIIKALKARGVNTVQRNADGSHSLVTEPKPKVKAKEVKSNAKSKEAETLLTPTSTEDQDMTRPQLMIQQGRAASSKTDRGKLEELAKWFEVPTRRKNVLRSSTAVAKDIREAAENAANPTLTPEKLEAARNLSIVEATKEQITHFAELFNVPTKVGGKPRGKVQTILEIRKAANEYKLKDTPQIIEQRKRALGKLEKMPNIPPAQVKAVKHLLEGGTITTSVETTGKRQSDQGFTNRSLRAAENKGLIKQDPTTGKWRVTIDDIAVGKRDVTEIPATPEEIDVLLNSHGVLAHHSTFVKYDKPSLEFVRPTQLRGWGAYFAKSKHEAKAYLTHRTSYEDIKSTRGIVYSYNIPDSYLDRMLNWDANIHDQPTAVKEALRAIPKVAKALDDPNSKMYGGEVYYILESAEERKEAYGKVDPDTRERRVAEEFVKLGIIGNVHRYKMSALDKPSDINYVIWDKDALDKIKRVKTDENVKLPRYTMLTAPDDIENWSDYNEPFGAVRPHEASTLSLNKGEHFRSSEGNSYADYEVMPDGSIVLHDVWTDESQRNQGVATKLIKDIIEKHPDATIWTGAVSPGMDKISENLGFKLHRKKQTSTVNTPKSVDYSNANVWVRPGKNYNPEEVPKFAVGSTNNPMSIGQVHAEIQDFLKTKRTPKFIKVIQHFEELPQALQDVYGPTPFEGITYKGTVYLIADNIKNSVGTLRGILTHEGGHLLLAADTVWAKRWKQVLDSLKNQTEFSLEDRALLNRAMKQVEEVRKNNYAMTDEMAQEEQMMYYLGYIAKEQASEQALEKKYSLYSKIKKWVRDVLIRLMGFSAEKIGMTLTTRDITMMIHKDLMRAATKPLVSTDSQISTPAKINAMSRFEEEFIKGKGPKAATATEWTKTLKSWIDKSMPNPVKEELYWSGILEWLDGKEGKITQNDILDFLKYNGLKSQVNVKITTNAALPHKPAGTDPWLYEMLPNASRETLVSLYKAGAIPDTEDGLKAQAAAEVLLKYPNQELEPLYEPWDTARENLLKVFPSIKDTTRDIIYSNTWEMMNDPINWRRHLLNGLPDAEYAKISKMLEVPQVQQAVQDFLREAAVIREDEHTLYSYMDTSDSNDDARLEAEERDLDLHRRATVNWSNYAIVKPNKAAETFNIEINIPEHTKDIPVYTSPHYDKTPNQLVSARVQVLDTGELFINEIQSDLHQRESTLHTGLPFKTNYITVALKEIIKEAVKRNVHTIVWPSSPVQVRKIENWDPIMVYNTTDNVWEDLLGEAKSGSINQTTRNIGASVKRNILKYGGKLGTVTLDDIRIELQTNPLDSIHTVSNGFLIGTLSDDYNASIADAHERILNDLEAQGIEVYDEDGNHTQEAVDAIDAEEVHQVTWPGIVTKIPHIFATKAEAETALKQIQETGTADFVMEYNALAITPELAALASEGKLPMASVPEHRSVDEILKDVFGDRPATPDEAVSAFRADRITSSDSIAQRAKDPDVRAVGKLMANILRSTLGFVHSAQNETAPKKKKKGIAGVNKYERTKDTQTTNIFTRLFSLPEYYMRKDSTAERVLEHALAQSDIKYLAEKSILGETFLDTLDRVRKDKTSYDQAKKYLLETDRTGVGYSISFYKGAWNVLSPLGKVILTYKTEEEAVAALVEQEQVDLRARKFSDNALAMVKEVRDLTNRGFDLLAADMRRQIKLAKDNGLVEPTTKHINNKGKEETISLSEAIALMGDLRGTYFPRERPQKNYVVTAQKPGLLGKKELIPVNLFLPGNTEQHPFRGKIKDFINQHLPVKKIVDDLLAKGYTEEEISINPVKSVSDEIFDVPGLLTATDSLLAAAIENTEREDMSEIEIELLQNITQKLTQNIGNIYKAKGSFSSRVKRADTHWEGYEEDPQKALTSYAQRLAAGVARRTTARGMLEAFTGRDISWAQFRKDNPTAKYKDYRAEVKRRAISAITQKNLYDDVRLYMTHVLRPDSAVDRFVGYLKGLSVLSFLGFRVSSAAVNMTNMAMAVPATIAAHTGLSLTKSWSEITSAAAKYAKFRASRLEKTGVISSAFKEHLGKLAISPEDEAIFNMIARNGWDEAQFNQDSVRVLQDTLSEGWNKTMAAAMFMFGAAERANRAITIFAAAKAYMKADPKMSIATALKKAHYTSNRAHGQYGKGAKPWLVQKVRFLDLPYTFFKFQQNYMLNMLELGVKYGSWKNAAYMLMSPAVLSGAGASLLMPVVAAALKAAGSDDPEEEFYTWAENTFGSDTFARHGLAGLAGVNLKGSLEINSPFPDLTKGWLGAMGAPGGVFINLADAINKFSEGQYLKGTEKLLPSAAGSIVKGYREYTEGVSTETYAPVFVGTERLMGTPIDFAARLFSFNPEKISGIRQQQWREDQVRLEYQKLRTKITTGFNHLLENPSEASQDDYASLYQKITDYNNRVAEADPKYQIPYITTKWLNASIKRSQTPDKYERSRK